MDGLIETEREREDEQISRPTCPAGLDLIRLPRFMPEQLLLRHGMQSEVGLCQGSFQTGQLQDDVPEFLGRDRCALQLQMHFPVWHCRTRGTQMIERNETKEKRNNHDKEKQKRKGRNG